MPIRTPAIAATDNGLLAPEPAAGIARVKRAKSIGVRAGDWPTLRHANASPNAPDIATAQGLRDRAIIAVLLGRVLRRPAVAAVTMGAVRADSRRRRWSAHSTRMRRSCRCSICDTIRMSAIPHAGVGAITF